METRDLAPRNWFRRRQLPVKKEGSALWEGFDRDIERIFEDFTGDFGNFENFLSKLFKANASASLKILPRTDFSETDQEYMVEVDLPGVKEENLEISLSKDNVLTIQGKRESQEEKKERNYYKLERAYGSFERTLMLPDNCDADKVSATFKDGILTIQIPKKTPIAGEVKKIKLSTK